MTQGSCTLENGRNQPMPSCQKLLKKHSQTRKIALHHAIWNASSPALLAVRGATRFRDIELSHHADNRPPSIEKGFDTTQSAGLPNSGSATAADSTHRDLTRDARQVCRRSQ
ncbi:hypothetical protein PAXRUDRAFT_316563 [Paxillus rubicundulus Ve08.2h10]|uniref:Uncharacterized protein n=1 Tax=Paxillus rubicundulus Ve08.2h10 TaxID=930991 RepID=A0A0D0DN02_9AGAM|nr:hypothetical protein PAXRUDRAFT_316563 [Paxillus rubicundulus Ve08.2h10]